jgi:ATP-binding cassette subfamily B protein/subfamily B ATP-binding cassette protein MsbA
MKNFGRVVRLALRHRWTFVGSILCALMVAVLWGGNITVVYPFVKVAFQGDSFQGELDAKIDHGIREVAARTATILELQGRRAGSPPGQREEIDAQLRLAESELGWEVFWLEWFVQFRPYCIRYLPQDAFKTLALLIGLLLFGTILKSLFVIANSVLVGRLAQLGTFELRNLFYRRTLRMDLATFTGEGTADLMSRFTHDMTNTAGGLNVLFGKLVREPLKMVFCLTAAAVICWPLLLFSLAILPLAALLIRWLARTLKRVNRRAMEEMAQLYSTLQETFRGVKVVKAFTMEPNERKRFHSNAKEYYKRSMKIVRYDALSHPTTELTGMLIICVALLAGAYLAVQGKTHLAGIPLGPWPLTPELLALFYAFLAGAADPGRKLSDVFTALQRAAAASDRIYAMLDREPAVREPACPRPLARHQKHLVFENVDFAYTPGRPVLQGIDLSITFGETIAIVGPSGCGKSTLASLIPRFAEPAAGSIRLDGVPLDEVRLRDLRSQIGLVTQEPFLFDDTVFNNIRYGSLGATREQVVEAATQAHAHRFIEQELSQGYDSPVGPMGGQLSGGQRQRIALARAILRDPAILILDEATSQIDLESERLIQSALDKFVRGRTAVIITHRLGVLSLADRIVAMEEGRILDVGSHDELAARCPSYRRLYQIEFDDLRESA